MRKAFLFAAMLFLVPSLCPAQDQALPNNVLTYVSGLPATCTPGVTPAVELSVAPYSINYCSATNTWSALTASSGSTWSSLPGGTNNSSAFVCGTGCSIAASGTGTITATNGVNSITNDTNVTGSLTGGALTLGWAGTLAKPRLLATTVFTDQANTFGNFAQDFSGASIFRVRVGASLTTSINGDIGYDTANNNLLAFKNGANSYIWTAPVSGTFTNNDCAKFFISSGAISLVDAGNVCNGLPAGPVTPNGVTYNLSSTPVSGIAGATVWSAPGLLERDVTLTTATDVIQATDCNPMPVFYQGSVSVAVTLPTAATLGVTQCTLKLTNNTSGSATTVTVTPTTWTIVPNSAGTLTIAQGQSCLITVDASVATQWDATCADEPLVAGANITITRGRYGPTIAASGGGSSALSAITAATVANTIANGNFPQTWNWAQTTDAQDALTLGESVAATNGTLTNALANQAVLHAATLTASTATPLEIDQGSVTGTTGPPAVQIETTWNNAALVGEGLLFNVTNTASAAGSNLWDFRVGNVTQGALKSNGDLSTTGSFKSSAGTVYFQGTSGGVNLQAANFNSVIISNTSSQFLQGTASSNAVTVVTCDPVTGISCEVQAAVSSPATNISAAFTIPLKATAALTAGQVVKIDSANAGSVVVATTTDTGAGAVVGFVFNSPAIGATARLAPIGVISTPVLGTGTCSLNQFVINDTTTNGRVKCTSTFTAGTILGYAVTAQSTVGNTVGVYVLPR